MRPTLADQLRHFEATHGIKVEIALSALVDEQAKAARDATITEVRAALAESSEAYKRALRAWEQLAEAIDKETTP